MTNARGFAKAIFPGVSAQAAHFAEDRGSVHLPHEVEVNPIDDPPGIEVVVGYDGVRRSFVIPMMDHFTEDGWETIKQKLAEIIPRYTFCDEAVVGYTDDVVATWRAEGYE